MRRLLYILLLCLTAALASAREYGDSAIYQGLNVKVDLGNSIYQLVRSKGATQQYEAAFNVCLLRRFYPTIEGGYAWSTNQAASGAYKGNGGFFRVGMDLNPLRKNRSAEYALLVGLRLGVGMQKYSLTGVNLNGSYWQDGPLIRDFDRQFRADCWGEIVAGLQVKVAGPLSMGWYARVHALFTGKLGETQPYFIPGYGMTAGSIFSFNYYIGLRF